MNVRKIVEGFFFGFCLGLLILAFIFTVRGFS
jgi:hypothetical protein